MPAIVTFEQGNAVDTIAFDVTTSETHGFDADVTEHPVETGTAINDNVRAKPSTLKLEVMVTDYPLSVTGVAPGQVAIRGGIGGGAQAGRAAGIMAKLVKLREDGVRFFIETSSRTYENMVLKSVNVPRTKALSGALKLSLSFVEVRAVTSASVPVKVATTKAAPKVDGGHHAGEHATDATASKSWSASIFDTGKRTVKSMLGYDSSDPASEGMKKVVSAHH